MNRRHAVDHSAGMRMKRALVDMAGAFAVLALYIGIMVLMVNELEVEDAHRHAPANFHGQEVEWHREDAGPRNEEFTARD